MSTSKYTETKLGALMVRLIYICGPGRVLSVVSEPSGDLCGGEFPAYQIVTDIINGIYAPGSVFAGPHGRALWNGARLVKTRA